MNTQLDPASLAALAEQLNITEEEVAARLGATSGRTITVAEQFYRRHVVDPEQRMPWSERGTSMPP